jgi:hypothetical protein
LSLRVTYSPLMLRRVAEIRADVAANRPEGAGKTWNEDYCQHKYHLSNDYLRGIGKHFNHPSCRVLRNLGLELWVRDPRTGEEEKLDLGSGNWTPRDPHK